MKILICANEVSAPVTGSGRFARMLLSMQTAVPVCQIDMLSEDGYGVSEYIVKPSCLSRLPVLGYYFRSRRYCRTVARILESAEYDIVFFNDIWLAFALLPWLKSNRKTAAVSFMHDDNTLKPSDLGKLTWRSFTYLVRAYMEKRVIGSLDAVCTNSDYLLQLFQRQYPDVLSYRLYYAGMDYKTVGFRPRLPDPSKRIRVLFMKSDFVRGGLKELILALNSLKQYQFTLTITGPDPSNVQRKLYSLLKSTHQLSFAFHGRETTATHISMLYERHDLVCIPSHREALGLVNAEALAHGIPVVSSDKGGIPEVLDSGRCGYLVSNVTPSEIARKIEQCIIQKDTTMQMIRHGREFVLQKFDVDQMYHDLYLIFSDVLKVRQAEV